MPGAGWAKPRGPGAPRPWTGRPRMIPAKPNYDLRQVLDDAYDPAGGIVDPARSVEGNADAVSKNAGVPNMEAIYRDAVASGKADKSGTYFLIPSKMRLAVDGDPVTTGVIGRTTPGDWFQQSLLGDFADGVFQRFIERNPKTLNALSPHISSQGPKRNLGHSIFQVFGPNVEASYPSGTSQAWWQPYFSTAFVHSKNPEAMVHEMFHALLDPTASSVFRGQARMPVAKSKMWKEVAPAPDMPGGAMPEDIIAAYLKADAKKYPTASAMDQFDRPLDPEEYPFAADAAENAHYNRTAAEFRARLGESKWMQALHEGKFPETRAENIRLLQRLIDGDATYSAPDLEIKHGPSAGLFAPDFRTQQRALQMNWEASSPGMKRRIEDLFYSLGSNEKPGAATYG